MHKTARFHFALPVACSAFFMLSHVSIAAPAARPNSPNAEELARISSEPDPDQQARSLRWSSDSVAAAWLQLVRPDPKAIDKSPQNEIWSILANSSNPTGRAHQADSVHQADSKIAAASRPYLLVPALRVMEILRESGPDIHRRPDDIYEQNNPYLLNDFFWAKDHSALLLIADHSITWLDLTTGKAEKLLASEPILSDVTMTPGGRDLIFVREHQLWIMDLEGKNLRAVTSKPRQDIFEGELDWPYRNEFHQARAYWCSPASPSIAYLQIDDRQVAKYSLRSSDGTLREIVYPKPGGELPIVHVFVKQTPKSNPIEMQLGDTRNFYIPLVKWLPDGKHLAIERLNRRQQSLELLLADSTTGEVTTLLTEKDQYWINLKDDLYFFSDSGRFLWSSERTGFRHLYLYDLAGKQLGQLTRGEWEVTQLDAVDEAKQAIYLTSTQPSVLERHLYRLDLGDQTLTRITMRPGTHQPLFAPDRKTYIDVFSSRSSRPELTSAHGDTPEAATLTAMPRSEGGEQPGLTQKVEFLDLKLHQGLPVHAFLIKPSDFDPTHRYPVIVYLAGGPDEQLVRNAWAGANGEWMQLMARNGYLVFGLDNQGTAGRGHYFEEPIHLRLGGQELADQRDGLNYLQTLSYVDPTRVGVCGWGYGGFLAVHAMLDRPIPFKAGFAGAAITDWHYYDAIYAERYLDDPVAHADGWDASTALENAAYLKGALMLAQGTDDEFVHLENALTLQDELLDAGKFADMLLLPDRGHEVIDRPAKLVVFSRMTDFFIKNL